MGEEASLWKTNLLKGGENFYETGEKQPIIINIIDSNVEDLQIVIGNQNTLSHNDTKAVKRKSCFSFVLKLKKMLVKFLTEVDVNIIVTLLSMIFTLIK